MLTQVPIGSVIDHEGFGNQWARRRLLAWYKHSSMGLIALLAYVGHYKATDERDRIYAFLGICSQADRAIVGTPDYTLSVEEVYTRLVAGFMHQHRSLNILCFTALFTKQPLASEGQGRLPTWVPDWRFWTNPASRPVSSMVSEPSRPEIGNFREIRDPQHGVVDPDLVYSASAGLPAEFSVSADSRRLTCKGVVIDIIDGLGPVGLYSPDGKLNGYSSSTLVQSTSDVNTKSQGPGHNTEEQDEGKYPASYSIVESLVQSLTLDRAGRYLMWPADVDGYVHKLRSTLLDPTSSALENCVSKFFAAVSELSILQASLMEHLETVGLPTQRSDPWGEYYFLQASEITVGERPWDCRLITTDQGHLGMAPRQAMKGDVVAVLVGCSVPVILRRSGSTDQHELIGEAFVPGFMKGEALGDDAITVDITLV